MSEEESNRKLLSTYKKDLPCKLHEQEVADHAQRLAGIEEDLAAHKEAAKSVKADLAAKEAALVAERTSLARKVRTKEEVRPVTVNIYADFDLGKAVFERNDTGDVLEARALTDAERQTAMFRKEHEGDERTAKEIADDLFQGAQQGVKPKPADVVKFDPLPPAKTKEAGDE